MSASESEVTPLLSPEAQDLETQADGTNDGTYHRKPRPRIIDWDERDRLLQPGSHGHGCSTGSLRESYVHHDDPAVRILHLFYLRWVSATQDSFGC